MKKLLVQLFCFFAFVFASFQTFASEVNIYLIRHGKTMFNTTGQVQGWSDSPLTDKGISQALQAGKGLEDVTFISAYSSDMGRARATAKLILKENKNQPTPEIIDMMEFREWGYGGYEGRDDAELWTPLFEEKNIEFKKDWSTWEDLTKAMTDEEMANAIAKNDPTGTAESYDEITARLKSGILEVVKETEAKGGGNILIVSHGSSIPTILSIFTPDAYHGESIDNASLTLLKYKDGQFTLEKVGDTSYFK